MDIATLIQNFGFPIACVVVMGWFYYKVYNDMTSGSKEREEKFYTELAMSREANAKFAEIITTYTTKLDVIQGDVRDVREKIDTKLQ